ncbi:MAG TPA: hypothetical protein PKY56_00110 [Candidatus Kapabacteria bacterium]|nr:hypothetical protein [Candidatus Kapabacteria bacterium]
MKIFDHKRFVSDNILASTSIGDVAIISEEQFHKAISSGLEVYSEEGLNKYFDDLQKAFSQGKIGPEDIEKANIDKSKLVKVIVVHKDGTRMSHWVKRGEEPKGSERESKIDQVWWKMDKAEKNEYLTASRSKDSKKIAEFKERMIKKYSGKEEPKKEKKNYGAKPSEKGKKEGDISGWLYLNKAGDGPSKDGYADAGEFGKEEAERLAKKFGGKVVTSYGGFKEGTGKESEKWIVKYKRNAEYRVSDKEQTPQAEAKDGVGSGVGGDVDATTKALEGLSIDESSEIARLVSKNEIKIKSTNVKDVEKLLNQKGNPKKGDILNIGGTDWEVNKINKRQIWDSTKKEFKDADGYEIQIRNSKNGETYTIRTDNNNSFKGSELSVREKLSNYEKQIAEAYHKAKLDGSNPELVKAVEDLLGKKETTKPSEKGFGSGKNKEMYFNGVRRPRTVPPMKKELKQYKDKTGYCLEVYINGELIDWRRGLTKSGFNKYLNNYNTKGYLSEGTKENYN